MVLHLYVVYLSLCGFQNSFFVLGAECFDYDVSGVFHFWW
jgi:hypothetical protein